MRWRFKIDDPRGHKTAIFTNGLLNTEERAKERAMAEFLNLSYRAKRVTIKTPRTDIILNGVYKIGGIPYIAKDIQTSVGASLLNTITFERYD